ncbi:thioredoxin family protein [Bacteroidota bacterium]
MKKFILPSIVLILTSVISCSSKNNSEPDTNQKTEKHFTLHLTKSDFLAKVVNYEANPNEWNYKGDKPCLIDFYADWCGPCKIAAPILEDLAKEYDGQIYVYKINTDKERELAADFGIQGIPAFLFVPMKGNPTMSSGIARTPDETKQMFRKMIDELLLAKN